MILHMFPGPKRRGNSCNYGAGSVPHNITSLGEILIPICHTSVHVIELLFVFVEAVFVAPRSEELGITT